MSTLWVPFLGKTAIMKNISWLGIFFLISLISIVHVNGRRGNKQDGRTCEMGWKEIAERIEYTPGSGQRILFPDAELQLCDVPCDTRNVTIQLSMVTNHIGKGCDRDTYSVESQRKLCGASAESVDLLPSPGIGNEWTKELRTDEGRESDQMYEFDGSTTAVVVPEATLNHSLGSKFSISLWMKHEDQGKKKKHGKEAILCSSDDHKKDRHHYSLFVRNCRLVLLLRQEHNEDKHVVYRPAEWRWKLPQVCDNEWHHYSVAMDFPKASLFVDGRQLLGSEAGAEVIDDYPLHMVRGLRTTLAIGACWQGRESQMTSHFRGYLAGLSLLRGRTENPAVLSCLHRCQEELRVPPAESIDAGTRLSVNSEASAVSISGRDSIDVEDLLSQVSYQNLREFPTPGRRSLRLITSVACSDGKAIQVPNSHSYLVVLPPEQPSISLNGTANLAREYESFMQGIELFSTVVLQVNHEAEQDDDDNDGDDSRNDISDRPEMDSRSKQVSDHKLDACNVRVYPPLNVEYESLRLPVNYMQHLGVHYKETKDGLVIHGADTVRSYQTILRQIVYFNRKPAYYLNRSFKLSCSELNGRFTSNDYIQTLTVIHPSSRVTEKDIDSVTDATTVRSQIHPQESIPQAVVAKAQVHEHKIDLKDSRYKSMSSGGFLDSSLVDLNDRLSRPSAINSHVSPIVVGHAVTVIIVVCVGLLVFMVVLGVIRIRAAHHRTRESRDDEQEMVWDDTALTITVNPLDQIEQEGTAAAAAAVVADRSHVHDEEEESDSSGTSYREDGESSSEEEADEVLKSKSMTWDDSALNF